LTIDPLYPDALTNLGLCHESLGQGLDAEKCYRRALRLTPDDPETMELLGRRLVAAEKYPDAVRILTQLKRLIPDDLEVGHSVQGTTFFLFLFLSIFRCVFLYETWAGHPVEPCLFWFSGKCMGIEAQS
jgi:tetratricopeptide (TPR) repeat protein